MIIPNNKIWEVHAVWFQTSCSAKKRVLTYSPNHSCFPPGAVVSAVEATGLIATWNQQHPQEAIGVWDRLLAVNGITTLNENLADELLGSLIKG